MTTSILSVDLIKKFIKKLTAVLFWIAVWFVLFKITKNDFLLCSPMQVLTKLRELVITEEFWITTAVSILRISVGYLSGIFFGTLIAILTSLNSYIDTLFRPLLTIIKTTPVASFILLLLVWIKRDSVPSFISFLMVVPIAWSNVSTGIFQVDNNLKEVGRVYRFSLSKKIRHIYIPSIKPYFLSACTTALGLSWKAGIAAGVISQPDNSIGTKLYSSKIYLETDSLFAWTAVVIIISVILEKIVKSLINKVRG